MLTITLLGIGAIACICYGLYTVKQDQRIKKEALEFSKHVNAKQEELNTWYDNTYQLLQK